MFKNMLSKALHRYAVTTAFATFFLLIAGSLVTSTDSGLAVPDWPLSYGTWFPPMVGGIFYEHGHRMIAGLVGLMILGLAVTCAKAEKRGWVRRLSFIALGTVVIQAVLGGLTVIWLLPPAVSIAHAFLGQTVFCLVVLIAAATSPAWEEKPAPNKNQPGSIKRWVLIAAYLAAFQLLIGAVIRHTGRWVIIHVIGAATFTVVFSIMAVAVSQKKATFIKSGFRRLSVLLAVQLIAGVCVYFYRSVVPLRTLHVGVGALILAQSVMLAWDVMRRTHVKW